MMQYFGGLNVKEFYKENGSFGGMANFAILEIFYRVGESADEKLCDSSENFLEAMEQF